MVLEINFNFSLELFHLTNLLLILQSIVIILFILFDIISNYSWIGLGYVIYFIFYSYLSEDYFSFENDASLLIKDLQSLEVIVVHH